MIESFETTARLYPERVFLSFVDESGSEVSFTYRQARLIASVMARRMRGKGVKRGDFLSVDLPNCPEFVFLALAAGYGSFALVCINHRLSSTEKMTRLFDLEREGVRVACRMDLPRARRLMDYACSVLEIGEYNAESVDDGLNDPSMANRRFNTDGYSLTDLERRHRRTIMGIQEDAINDAIHYAERQAHLFDSEQPALLMFTSGTTGKSKAVVLTWEQLLFSAESSNQILSRRGTGLWQAALPLYHIGGFQVMVRSVTNLTPFRLYARFEPDRILWDAVVLGATHISVVDKMLRDLLTADTNGVMADYHCVLLGGGPLNRTTIDRALAAGVRVYASYGMTETASQIANALVTPGFTGGMNLLPGYSARIIDPDDDGFGQLAVRGLGLFSGYLSGTTAFTVDGYFLTGDTAALYDGQLYVRERTTDMFISGGENIYPAQVAQAITDLPGIGDAFVFGVEDATWGRRPVAFAETTRLSGSAILRELRKTLSSVTLPKQVLTVPELPRIGIGKIDRERVLGLYERRLEAAKILLYRVRLPFREPFVTARATLQHRDLIIVEVIDPSGRSGLGECSSFETNWYLPETLNQDWQALTTSLGPALLGQAFLHPRELADFLAKLPEADACPMAASALEMAFWDLHGKIQGKPFWSLLNGEYLRLRGMPDQIANLDALAPTTAVAAGAVVGMGSPRETVEAVRACVDAGYMRIKLKISPGQGYACVQAVRQKFPDILITLDANQSFPPQSLDDLSDYDQLNAAWIEEPLALQSETGNPLTGQPAFTLLAALQQHMATPICLDESFTNRDEAALAFAFEDLHIISLKIGKFGGIQNGLAFLIEAQNRNRDVWMGGMFDSGISRRVHAAFQTLPGLVFPGDIGSTARYFTADITNPLYVTRQGSIVLNEPGFETGIGCELNREVLKRLLVAQAVLE